MFKTVFAALEQRTLSLQDLDNLLQGFIEDPAGAGVPEDIIILDSGYWLSRNEIVGEGTCRCERQNCVGYNGKVYCYFQKSLSAWVISTGLFWRCYDQIISCPRCSSSHKRGHIGREGICAQPYRNQKKQRD